MGSTLIESIVFRIVYGDWETIKGQVGGLTSEAAIATFLAAVQSQIVALSYQDNSSRLKTATNALGFAGVLLDVITACLAMWASSILQRHISVVERQIDAIEDASPAQITEMYNFLDRAFKGRLAGQMFPEISRRIIGKMRARLIVLRSQHHTESADDPLQLNGLSESPGLNMEAVPQSIKHIRGATAIGDAAGTAMLFGVLCFFASVVCLAISTQPPVVWIVSVLVCSLVVVLPTVNGLLAQVGIRLPSVFDI
ncbi:hypothetical protein B0H19DRAFT_286567 [Mycena capillaripes]|nr:hypothetical protein B0H19DRAFT_286567 [Mycena capillaripes]